MNIINVSESLIRKANNTLDDIPNKIYSSAADYFSENIGCGLINSESLASLVSSVNNGLVDVMKPLGAVSGLINGANSAIIGANNAIKGAAVAITSLNNTVNSAVNVIVSAGQLVNKTMNTLGVGVDIAVGVVNATKAGVMSIVDSTGKVIANATSAVTNLINNPGAVIDNLVASATKLLGNVVNGVMSTVSGFLNKAGTLLDKGLALFSNIADSILDVLSSTINFNLDNLFSDLSVSNFFEEIIKPLTCPIPALVKQASTGFGVIDSIQNASNNLANVANNLKLPTIVNPIPGLIGSIPSLSLQSFAPGSISSILNNLTPFDYAACVAARKLNNFGNFNNVVGVLDPITPASSIGTFINRTTQNIQYCCNTTAMVFANDKTSATNTIFQDLAADKYTGNDSQIKTTFGFNEDNLLNRTLGTLLENRVAVNNMQNQVAETNLNPLKINALATSLNESSLTLDKLNTSTVSNNYAVLEEIALARSNILDSYINI